jgi:hypothetical protein
VSEIVPGFGTVHPFEGMRPFLYEEEAIAVYIALEALHRFFRASYRQLAEDTFPAISKRYRIPIPLEAELKSTVSVKVATLPEVASELLDMAEQAEEDDFDEDDFDEEEMAVPLRDDLVPKDAFLSLGMMPGKVWNCYDLVSIAISPKMLRKQERVCRSF